MDGDDDIEDIFLDNDDKPARHHQDLHPAVDTQEERKKFAYALGGLLAVSMVLTTIRGWDLERFMSDLMAFLFIGGAAFKFAHLEAFAFAYRSYDVIGSRLRPWGYLAPFLEAFLGFWYLLSTAPLRLNLLALAIASLGAFGAIASLRHHTAHAHHPSVGGLFRLPLPRITATQHTLLVMLAILQIVLE